MSNEDVVGESGEFRVRLEYDQDAQEPDWCQIEPILSLSRHEVRGLGGLDTNHYATCTSCVEPNAARIIEAAQRFLNEVYVADAVVTFIRYLRIFHGTTKVRKFGNAYMAFDTQAWREMVGIETDAIDPQTLGWDFEAWADGEVYGYVVERKVERAVVRRDSSGQPVVDLEDTTFTWEHEESCWGFYGRDYAEEEAERALAYAVDFAARNVAS